jgi:hypothetical protein
MLGCIYFVQLSFSRKCITGSKLKPGFEADTIARDGGMAPLIYNAARMELTDLRTKDLQKSMAVR